MLQVGVYFGHEVDRLHSVHCSVLSYEGVGKAYSLYFVSATHPNREALDGIEPAKP